MIVALAGQVLAEDLPGMHGIDAARIAARRVGRALAAVEGGAVGGHGHDGGVGNLLLEQFVYG